MKRFTNLALAAIFLATPTLMVAEDIIAVPIKTGNGRRDISGTNSTVSCMYQNGVLNFSFERPLGKAYVYVTNEDTGNCTDATITAAYSQEVYVGTEAGHYTILLTTSQGDCYDGEFTLD